MKIRRSADTLRVSMQGSESALLTVLFDDFSTLVEAEDEDETGYRDDPVTQRLYPDGYSDDEAASAEYRELVAGDLREQRRSRLKLCRDEVTGSAKIELDPDGAERWLAVLNDLRLALGTRLGVTEETDLEESQPAQVYHWLTAVQDMFIEHLMR